MDNPEKLTHKTKTNKTKTKTTPQYASKHKQLLYSTM